jgi:hypothetical protein
MLTVLFIRYTLLQLHYALAVVMFLFSRVHDERNDCVKVVLDTAHDASNQSPVIGS